MKPIFIHDCSKCTLVAITELAGDRVEWYICGDDWCVAEGKENTNSIIGRWSSEDSEYWSWPIDMLRPGGSSKMILANAIVEALKVQNLVRERDGGLVFIHN